MSTMKQQQKEVKKWMQKSLKAQKDTDFIEWYEKWKTTASVNLVLKFDFVAAWECFNAGKKKMEIKKC